MMPHAPAAAASSPLLTCCRMRVDGEHLLLPTGTVREALAECTPSPVPRAPRIVAGLLPHRGEALLVLSLRGLLERERRATGDVLVLGNATLKRSFGLLVDEVCEVLELEACALQPVPPSLPAEYRRLLSGVYQHATGLLCAMDPARLASVFTGLPAVREPGPR